MQGQLGNDSFFKGDLSLKKNTMCIEFSIYKTTTSTLNYIKKLHLTKHGIIKDFSVPLAIKT